MPIYNLQLALRHYGFCPVYRLVWIHYNRRSEAHAGLLRVGDAQAASHYIMSTILKLIAAAALAVSILAPGFTPRADTCECKAKAGSAIDHLKFMPRADTCECKAKSS